MIRGILSIAAEDKDLQIKIFSGCELNDSMGPEMLGAKYGGFLAYQVKSRSDFKGLVNRSLDDFGCKEKNDPTKAITEYDFSKLCQPTMVPKSIKMNNFCWARTDFVYFKNLTSENITIQTTLQSNASSPSFQQNLRNFGCSLNCPVSMAIGNSVYITIEPQGFCIFDSGKLLAADRLEAFITECTKTCAPPDNAF